MNYKIIFIIEILAFISISFWAAAMEGSTGGIFGIRTLNIFGLNLNADFFIFTLTIPLFLLIPLLIKPDVKLFGVLTTGYIVGIILEDFFWFVFNPYYGIKKFNSKNAIWLVHWIKIWNVEIPLFYIRYILGAIIVYFIFVSNSKNVEKVLKIFKRKIFK